MTTERRGWMVRIITSGLGLLIATSGGCASSRELGDSSTNWLRACVFDDDCSVGSCIEQTCTVSCEGAPAGETCEQVHASAECRTVAGAPEPFCDVTCEIAADCAALGAGYYCELGSCRFSRGVEPDLAAVEVGLWDENETHTSGRRLVSAGWVGDRWRVVVQTIDAVLGKWPVATIDISRAGETQVQIDETAAIGTFRDMTGTVRDMTATLAPNGVLGYVVEPSNAVTGAPCRAQFHVDASGTVDTLPLPCAWSGEPMARLLPVPNSDDWLVMRVEQRRFVELGRYDPVSSRWTVEPTRVLELPEDDPETEIAPPSPYVAALVQGDDMLIVWSRRGKGSDMGADVTRILRVEQAAASEASSLQQAVATGSLSHDTWPSFEDVDPSHAQEVTGVAWSLVEYVHSVAPRGWLQPSALLADGGRWNPHYSGPFIWARPILDGGEVGADVLFELDRPENYGGSLRGSSVSAPQEGLVGFCHIQLEDGEQERDVNLERVAFSVFDETGLRVAGPIVLRSAGNRNQSACTVAWSEDEKAFLVSWVEQNAGEATPRLLARVIRVR